MSSTMAAAVTKTRSCRLMRLPSSARMPNVKAMSVAMGMPQPRWPMPPAFTSRYSAAGNSIPPTAASTGSAAFRRDASSPTMISRFTSRPMTKKNIAIRPSLIQCSAVSDRTNSPTLIAIGSSHRAK